MSVLDQNDQKCHNNPSRKDLYQSGTNQDFHAGFTWWEGSQLSSILQIKASDAMVHLVNTRDETLQELKLMNELNTITIIIKYNYKW